MSLSVLLVVLAAAALHAAWNAVIKIGLDRYLSITLISLSGGALALLCLIASFELPRATALPWLALGVVLHTGYKLFLIQAYSTGDMAQVYPIARGTAPLLVAVAATVLYGEHLSLAGYLGIAVLGLGVLLMSWRGGARHSGIEARAVAFALATAVMIAGYTLVDALGARHNGSAWTFVLWLMLLDAALMLVLLLAVRGRTAVPALLAHWRMGLAGGAMANGGYAMIVWAMTVAPVAIVAAVRETSVLFALALSALVLHEPVTGWRLVAAALIIAGAILSRTP